LDDNKQDSESPSGADDETLSTQDMDEVAGGGCMTFVDTAGCSSNGGGGGGGGGGTSSGGSTTTGGKGH